jgi:L-2-hydroxyglutarate oxidase LhgO
MGLAVIIGGGVTGTAIARRLVSQYDVAVFDKHRAGEAQSGHNSGVNHPGIIHDAELEPLKSFHAVRGNRMNWEYIKSKIGSPFEIRFRDEGELIVARTEDELAGLDYLRDKAQSRNIKAFWMDKGPILQREPGIIGVRGLWVPSSGVFDQVQFFKALQADAQIAGATYFEHTAITSVEPVQDGFRIIASNGDDFVADVLINAAGLYADTIARQCGIDAPQVYPYRGEYVNIHPSARIVKNLVYFPPEPGGLGHGMHFMRTPSGQVMYGPSIEHDGERNAKEDYANRDTIMINGKKRQTLEYFYEEARRAFPQLRFEHLSPDIVGIRAKTRLPGSNDPSDFYIQPQMQGSAKAYHIIADSPGLTACLSIAEDVYQALQLPEREFAVLTGQHMQASLQGSRK